MKDPYNLMFAIVLCSELVSFTVTFCFLQFKPLDISRFVCIVFVSLSKQFSPRLSRNFLFSLKLKLNLFLQKRTQAIFLCPPAPVYFRV